MRGGPCHGPSQCPVCVFLFLFFVCLSVCVGVCGCGLGPWFLQIGTPGSDLLITHLPAISSSPPPLFKPWLSRRALPDRPSVIRVVTLLAFFKYIPSYS